MSCQNSTIMVRAAVLPGQTGLNGHTRARPGGREAGRPGAPYTSSMRFKTALRTVAGTVSRGSDW
jgi:hypothetical protein